ncbi:flagellar biosynthetic protein FlhB [Clostridia bacterium]|nr:flagellar biosynthetic protein FlhB [Clostridia bacterium]
MKEGNVLQSKEMTTTASIAGSFCAIAGLSGIMYTMLKRAVKVNVEYAGTNDPITISLVMNRFIAIITDIVIILGPLFFVVMLVPVITVFAQTKGFFNFQHIKFDFKKLNPIAGFKKLFSLSSLFNVVKGIVELVIILAVLYSRLRNKLPDIVRLSDMDIVSGIVFSAHVVFDVAISIAVLFVFISAGDYLYQWWQYEKNLKMSKDDIKEEHKQMEGDPHIKAKIKQKQREISQMRMKEQVSRSDVVVRNPEHIAVALRYDPEMAVAPYITVLETDRRAMRVISFAMEANVPVVTNRELAREIYGKKLKPGSLVPADLFGTIANIFMEHVLKDDEALKKFKLK